MEGDVYDNIDILMCSRQGGIGGRGGGGGKVYLYHFLAHEQNSSVYFAGTTKLKH